MPDRRQFIARTLLAWYHLNARNLPWRRTSDPYAIWISEIMLQQTQVKTVLPYWQRWIAQFPTIRTLANAPLEQVLKAWEGLGYYTRARSLHRAAKMLVAEQKGTIPRTFPELLALPGIGPYTAGAICSIAFDQPTPILDGNIVRVLSRLFGVRQNVQGAATRARLWKLAEDLVAAAETLRRHWPRPCSHFNQALMELGAMICRPRDPRCGICPLRNICYAVEHDCVERLPNTGIRTRATERRFIAFALQDRGRWLIRQRPAGVVNAGLWEFPNCEVTADETVNLRKLAKTCAGAAVGTLQPLGTIRHTITRYRIRLEVFAGSLSSGRPPARQPFAWHSREELDQLAFPSAHRRIVQQLDTLGVP